MASFTMTIIVDGTKLMEVPIAVVLETESQNSVPSYYILIETDKKTSNDSTDGEWRPAGFPKG